MRIEITGRTISNNTLAATFVLLIGLLPMQGQAVDGETKFQTEPMPGSAPVHSDPVQRVDEPLSGAHELRSVADDGGDDRDMANRVNADLARDPGLPFFGKSVVHLDGKAAPAQTATAGGFALIASKTGPQVAVMEMARAFTISVKKKEQVRWTIPTTSMVVPSRISADVRVIGGGSAQVELALGGKRVIRTIGNSERVRMSTDL